MIHYRCSNPDIDKFPWRVKVIITSLVIRLANPASHTATLAIPSSMQADVIDYDELMTGERREGQYVGIWSFAKKSAAAIGVGLGLTILGISGYEPNIIQNDDVTFTLRVLYSLVPCICNAAGFLIALSYPITESKFKEIRNSIAEKKLSLEK